MFCIFWTTVQRCADIKKVLTCQPCFGAYKVDQISNYNPTMFEEK